MDTNIVETLPWIDYRELLAKIEERGRNEGRTEGRNEGRSEGRSEGKVERDREIAAAAFSRLGSGGDVPATVKLLKSLGIPADAIKAAQEQAAGRQ